MKTKNYLLSLLAAMTAAVLSVGMASCDNEDPELAVDRTTVNLQASGDAENITVTVSNTDWNATVEPSSQWLQVNKNGQLATITADPNTSTTKRTGIIKITATANASLSKEISVEQAGADGVISVSVPSVEFEADGGSVSIQVTSNSTWSVSGNPSWLTVGPSSITTPSTNGVTNVTLTASKNDTKDARPCTLIFTTTDNKGTVVVTVNQKRPVPFITVNGTKSDSHEFPGIFDNGKSGIDYKYVCKVNSNVEWSLSGKVDWLNISSMSGNGDVDLTIYPTSENESDKERKTTLTLSGEGASASIVIVQGGKYIQCYVIPDNEVALYNCFCWEFKGSSNANNFQSLLLSERDYNRLSDSQLREKIMEEEIMNYSEGWLVARGYDSNNTRIASNSTYYFVSLASDRDGKYGALQTIKMKTPAYLDEDQDAYVGFYNFDNNSYQFQFDVQKKGYCDTYHLVYGIYAEALNPAVYAFVINYYLKNKKKHWIASTDYYDWEIIANYPNDHTFSYTSFLMSYFPVCFAYGWGVFRDGKLSSDLIGFQIDTSSDESRQIRASRRNTESPQNIIYKRSELIKRTKGIRK